MTDVDSNTAEGDLLINLAVKNGMELKERALALQQKGNEIREWGQGKTEEWKQQIEAANPAMEELKAALLNDAPIETATLSTDRELLNGYIFTSCVLAAFGVGEIIGHLTGFALLGWWVSNGLSAGLIFGVIPAVYASLKLGPSPPSPAEQANYELIMGAAIGLLSGFNLSAYPAISLIPIAIVPFAQAATLRYTAPYVGNDRKSVIGVIAGAWIAPCVLLSAILGLNLAAITLWALTAVASAAIFQLVLYKREGRAQWLSDYGNLAILEAVVIAKTICTVALLKTYEQLRQNPPQQ